METRIMTLVQGPAGLRWELLQGSRESLKATRGLAHTLAERLPESTPEWEAARDVAEAISRLLVLLAPRVAAAGSFPGNDDRQLPVGDRLRQGA